MGRHSGAGSRAGSSGQHPWPGEKAGLGRREGAASRGAGGPGSSTPCSAGCTEWLGEQLWECFGFPSPELHKPFFTDVL